MVKNCAILFRTHFMNGPIERELATLADATGYQVYAVCDETSGHIQVNDIEKISVSTNIYRNRGLYVNFDAMWRCGDYIYDLVLEIIPEVDYYWMIEHDLYFNSLNQRNLFNFIDDATDADFVGVGTGLANEAWLWTPIMKPFVKTVYACVFPLTRISRRGAAIVSSERKRLSVSAIKIEESSDIKARITQGNLWPNDESFTPSVIAARGLQVENINSFGHRFVGPGWFLDPLGPHSRKWLQKQPADDFVYHPVLEGARYTTAISKFLKGQTRNGLSKEEVVKKNDRQHEGGYCS